MIPLAAPEHHSPQGSPPATAAPIMSGMTLLSDTPTPTLRPTGGYHAGHLYRCVASPYSVVVAARSLTEARDAFHVWLRDRTLRIELGRTRIAPAVTIPRGTPVLIAAAPDGPSAPAGPCPCWTDPELAGRGLFCPACTDAIARREDPPCSAAGGSWRVS